VRSFVVLAGVCKLAAGAAAQPAPPADDATRLFGEARAFKAAGNYDEACPRFQQSFALEHAAGTELNLGDCGEHFGRYREALQLYRDAAVQYEREGKASSAQFARDRAAALAARLATVIVRIAQPAEPGLAVAIAGHPVQPAAEIHELVAPGDVEVTADAPGRVRFASRKQAIAAATVEVDVPALAAIQAQVPAPVPVPRRESVVLGTERRRSRVHLAWAFGGVALGSAIAGTALTVVGNDHYDSVAAGAECFHMGGQLFCNAAGRKTIGDAQTLANAGTGFAIGAAVLAGVAAVVFVTAPRDPIVVAPTATASSVGVAVTGRF
jgi:hypothetical protein